MAHEYRSDKVSELRTILADPVRRVRLERMYFEATKSIPPQSDGDLLEAILSRDLDDQLVVA